MTRIHPGERPRFLPEADDDRAAPAEHRRDPNDLDLKESSRMRTSLLVLAAAAALATAGTAAAASGNGAAVVRDAGCTTSFFGTTCTVLKTVTNETTTPSGKISYVTNGTVERQITFVFGGTYTFTSSLHMHGLRAADEVREESDHYASQWEYVSGGYHLICVQSYDIHWANGDSQFAGSELGCTPA
jgi:hypothetical protein